MRKEIEVKVRVADLGPIEAKLTELGAEVSEAVNQRDETFVRPDYGPYEEFHPNKELLRIRESGGKHIFTLKVPQSNEQDAIEHETEIADAKEMREAILCMGYVPIVEIRKTRKTAHYKDIEICLDSIEGLGSFIEVERIIEGGDVPAVQEELFNFALSLGAKREDRVTQGYDTMVYLIGKK